LTPCCTKIAPIIFIRIQFVNFKIILNKSKKKKIKKMLDYGAVLHALKVGQPVGQLKSQNGARRD
jgi:hypothetical protein